MTVDPLGIIGFIIGIGGAAFLLWRYSEQQRIELVAVRKELRDAYEKINTMGYEIAELREAIGYEQGIFDKDYAEARRQKRIEELDKQESEPEPKPKKRGHHAG